MNGLVDLLCQRDNLTKNEAWDIVEATEADIMEAIYNGEGYEEVVSILEYDLGLEPEYLEILLNESF